MLHVSPYVIVSAVKDEEKYVELTLNSVARQTHQPARWVIVDDGSNDRTAHIVAEFAKSHPFIQLVQHQHTGVRGPGSPVIRAFDYGRSFLGNIAYDFIVKLDCDLSFEPQYFETLLRAFARHERLGIASGVYLERGIDGLWHPVSMPSYHAFGASKVVRRQCFEDIGGFAQAAGWDTVDEIKAIARGWFTTHFSDLLVHHHKKEGSAIGQYRTSKVHGEIFYATGGGPFLFAFKLMRRLSTRPIALGAMALAYGYFGSLLKARPRLVTASEANVYRRLLRERLFKLKHQSCEVSEGTPIEIG